MVKKKATEPEERKCKLKSCTKMAPWYLDRCSKHHDAYVKKCRARRRRETIAAQKRAVREEWRQDSTCRHASHVRYGNRLGLIDLDGCPFLMAP